MGRLAPRKTPGRTRVFSHTVETSRALLGALYRAALAGADPEGAVARALAEPAVARALARARSVGIFAAGKAAARMARGARSVAARRALVVLPRGHSAAGIPKRRVLFAAHPEPDASSVRAARAAVRFFRAFGEGDVIVCLVSGGASSLLCLPRKGLTLSAKRRAVAALAESGASILALNRLRTSLSAVKGGGLGRATRARLVTLVLSDVPGDRAAAVGSGPTVRGRRGDIVRVVGSNRGGLDAAAREARRRGLRVVRPRGPALGRGGRSGQAARAPRRPAAAGVDPRRGRRDRRPARRRAGAGAGAASSSPSGRRRSSRSARTSRCWPRAPTASTGRRAPPAPGSMRRR